MATFTPVNEPFLKHLAVQKTPYIMLTAETDDFDDVTLQDWRDEGFVVTYVPLGNGGAEYTRRLHAVADQVVGISEHYAIVAFGDAAAACLEAHIKAVPRLCALIAYYPSSIPDPPRTTYPMQMSVLIHLVGNEIGVNRTSEVLGIQGKRKTVRKRVEPGMGLGGEMKLSVPSYKYEGVESGFAEHDLDEYNPVATGLAWSRSLDVVRRAFGMKVDIERIRDEHLDHTTKANAQKAVGMMDRHAQLFHTPTLTGAIGAEDLETFYAEYFHPSPAMLNARLLSRTVGVDRVVDEMNLSFKHKQEIDWLLPGIPPTNRQIEITLVSIVCIKGGKLVSEHVYWDQASVLVQAGLLDPKNVPQKLKKEGIERLPVIGADGARAVLKHDARIMNGLIPDW
ncbi:hypothetical protein AAFC00_006691 [Neodothiora populina]|uniref:Dienelactone hydrolase n=1 Tax=Neodothiora populina TaxID=2781224 RepID=A0ABR3PAV0_9PEZI